MSEMTFTNGGVSLPGTNLPITGLPSTGLIPSDPTSVSQWIGLGSGTGSSSSSVFQVPVGPPQPQMVANNPDIPYISTYTTQDVTPTKTNQEIQEEVLTLQAVDPEGYKNFEDALSKSGYNSLDDLLYGASLAGQPWEEFLYQRASSGLFNDGSGSGGPTTTVTTNLSNRGQAYSTANPEFERGLGRQMSTDEVTEFQDTLNQFEKANPYVTNSGRGYSKTTGGFNPAELTRSFVEGQEDYAESQVASNFLGVLDRILEDPSNRPGPDLQERMARSGY